MTRLLDTFLNCIPFYRFCVDHKLMSLGWMALVLTSQKTLFLEETKKIVRLCILVAFFMKAQLPLERFIPVMEFAIFHMVN